MSQLLDFVGHSLRTELQLHCLLVKSSWQENLRICRAHALNICHTLLNVILNPRDKGSRRIAEPRPTLIH